MMENIEIEDDNDSMNNEVANLPKNDYSEQLKEYTKDMAEKFIKCKEEKSKAKFGHDYYHSLSDKEWHDRLEQLREEYRPKIEEQIRKHLATKNKKTGEYNEN